ncbi:sporulation protein [Paenibacillus hodogayensis]|uniref:Sporulation protein n=1 Tax=Paenibacillus hodogayensis TaxID=279208 RepID=A0ABV5W3J9_9BACL
MRLGMFHARSREYTVALAMLTALLVLSILLFPERAFQASLGGLTVWWNIVFPSLLPFLMLSELLGGFGAVRAIGTLLEPLTRLLFRIPGCGGWAIALGAIAGLPAGAEAAGKLRRDNLVSREEGERIVALSHVASPFFILTVIGAGFMHSVETGVIIAIVHYSSALAMGLLLRPLGSRPPTHPSDGTGAKTPSRTGNKPKSVFVRALTDMHRARLEDGRSLGKLLGDSVTGAIQTLMMIGGTMIVFSVLLGVLDTIGIGPLLARLASVLAPEAAAPLDTVRSLLSGMLELHIGTNRLSHLAAPGAVTTALIGAALAWSGLAVHLQVKTAIRHTDLRYRRFLLSRTIHAGIAVVMTFALYRPLSTWMQKAEPSFLGGYANGSSGAEAPFLSAWSSWSAIPERFAGLGIGLAAVMLLSLLISLWFRPGRTAR